MKLGLLADTHMPRRAQRLPGIVVDDFKAQKIACILHLGDLTTPAAVEAIAAVAPLEAVAGNNDSAEIHARFGRKKIVTFGAIRIGMVHGDGTKRTTLERSWRAFAGDQVDAILFGHSHIPFCEKREGVWLVNPGSPTDKRRSPFFSYGILEIKQGAIVPRLYFF